MLATALAILAQAAAAHTGPPNPPPAEDTKRTLTIKFHRTGPSCKPGCLSPVEAVTYASYLGNKAGVAGTFDMPVVTVGEQHGTFYLNSEKDYRDRNCLTVAITPKALKALAGSTDLDVVRKKLRNHRLIVRGIARQVRIGLTSDGKPTGKYYYQIHVRVSRGDQVRLIT
ncbi:hypothetical protein [Novosphingobium beihaiensis]|uniref:Uncharacterized protein n=1 Tax=Novosphingobium beihaiensis TaxID=2930389 RepID=A0ABT0BJU3_9SPHN|nr:hypothetical protein [Novosphingobium beihaiensis]MCJ2185299.1 hypothetical protein [Novosphingobium beihaiensis]